MTTLVLTYRNRDLNIVKKCLNSLQLQTEKSFEVILVDYGSEALIANQLAEFVMNYTFIKLITCPVQGQLWNKSRAINIALKQCETPYFLVGDIDLIFMEDFMAKLHQFKPLEEVIYFQVGFLSEKESRDTKLFNEYSIKHTSSKEATGITLFPTDFLKNINGYDEFYHGWGAEDTDVHLRLQNGEYEVKFYDQEILMLHQWHPKSYRSNESKEPFHSRLEQINHQYIQKIAKAKKVIANTNYEWGILPKRVLFTTTNTIAVTNQNSEIDAFLYGLLENDKGKNVIINITLHQEYNTIKTEIKKLLGKKHRTFYELQTINDLILGNIIAHYRYKYYEYEWNKEQNTIQLKIAL
jgi:glycosyltransferase involved in cell wall biosynthesis